MGDRSPPVEALAERFAELGYVDDAGFANAKAASLLRRGYGRRRIEQALYVAGIEEADGAQARELVETQAWDAALAFVRKRRIGPFAVEAQDPARRRKALAAMVRAGHSYELARTFIESAPGDVPERQE